MSLEPQTSRCGLSSNVVAGQWQTGWDIRLAPGRQYSILQNSSWCLDPRRVGLLFLVRIFLQSVSAKAHKKLYGSVLSQNVFGRISTLYSILGLWTPFVVLFLFFCVACYLSSNKDRRGRQGRVSSQGNWSEFRRLRSLFSRAFIPFTLAFQSGKGGWIWKDL